MTKAVLPPSFLTVANVSMGISDNGATPAATFFELDNVNHTNFYTSGCGCCSC